MGNVNFGPDPKRTLELAAQHGLETFVETGTYKGNTARWAAQHFAQVWTIEGDANRYSKTQEGLAPIRELVENVQYRFGDSRTELAQVLALVDAPCLIWLDAHWCGAGAIEAHQVGDECPLREELAAIYADAHAANHVIMIDDARLFTAPPPYPHLPEQWLTYPEIQEALRDREVFIENDVIYAVPHG